jgi:hypothetical protein
LFEIGKEAVTSVQFCVGILKIGDEFEAELYTPRRCVAVVTVGDGLVNNTPPVATRVGGVIDPIPASVAAAVVVNE